MNNLLLFYITPLIVATCLTTSFAQTGGTTATGDSYVCVPTGYCNNNGSPGGPGIDPRIVTPGQGGGLCPAGQVACFTQGPNSLCGNRFVPQTNAGINGPASPGAYPWLAYITNATHPNYAGAGVLINNYHILTAAHKVANSIPVSTVRVAMGVYNPSQIASLTPAAQIIVHERYDPTRYVNDIAIIRVSTPFALSASNINSACLPASTSNFIGQNCVVAGWGQIAFSTPGAPTNPLKQAYVNVVNYQTCYGSFQSILGLGEYALDPAGEICAGGQNMVDACTFDGGAPLICPATGGRGTIAGLVIWGKNCGQPGVYGVYVSVPYYRAWIDRNIAQLNAG